MSDNTTAEGAVKRSYGQQLASAVQNLSNGRTAKLSVPGYAVTAYVQRVIDIDDEYTLYATWQRDHVTAEVSGGPTLALPIADHRRAAAMAYAQLENDTQQL